MTCRYCCQKLPHRCAGMVREVLVEVEYVYPPIQSRDYDYRATFKGYDEGDPIGWGKTEREALKNLWEQLE